MPRRHSARRDARSEEILLRGLIDGSHGRLEAESARQGAVDMEVPGVDAKTISVCWQQRS